MHAFARPQRFGWLAAVSALVFALGSPAVGQVRFGGVAESATVRVLSWKDIPFRSVVRQQHDFSCGSAALATLLTYHYGRPTTEAEAFTLMYDQGDQAKIRRVGFSMLDMKRFLAAHDLASDGFRMSLDELRRSGAPAVVLIDLGRYRHFVVVKGVSDDSVLVGDPALGLRIFRRADFQRMWNGVAFALYEPKDGRHPRFNDPSEWRPWAVAPVQTALTNDTLTIMTTNQLPLYQITPVLFVPSVTIGG
jgi:predicted double-glycine peptidase